MKQLFSTTCMALLLSMLVGCQGPKSSTTKDIQVGPYTVSIIEDGVYHIQDFNEQYPAGESFDAEGKPTHFNNCSDIYLLVSRSKALMIDLSNKIKWADNAEESLRSIVSERIANKPLTITITHNHGDHTGMMDAFRNDPSVQFALPKADFANVITEEETQKWILFEDGYEFDLGDMTIQTIAVPGHTPGSTVFSLKGHNMLFTGDAIGSGHGVWIFNKKAFYEYISAVSHLIDFINNPANKINKDALKIFGGHYWQRDWLNYADGEEMGWQYIEDMKTLIDQMGRGEAYNEPSNLGRANLDTYFRHGEAILVWNKAEWESYLNK